MNVKPPTGYDCPLLLHCLNNSFYLEEETSQRLYLIFYPENTRFTRYFPGKFGDFVDLRTNHPSEF
jgi:hypothetical protein